MKHYYVFYLAEWENEEDPETGWGSDDIYAAEMDLEQITTICDIIAEKIGADYVKVVNWKEIP